MKLNSVQFEGWLLDRHDNFIGPGSDPEIVGKGFSFHPTLLS